jgi:hypothetical protein
MCRVESAVRAVAAGREPPAADRTPGGSSTDVLDMLVWRYLG